VLTEDVAGKVVVGWVEKGLILPEEAVVKVKVDSGALTSSMHAVNMERFTRKGKRWVRYDVPVPDAETGNKVTLQLESPAYSQTTECDGVDDNDRTVEKMPQCIGNRIFEEQLTLRDL